MTPPENWIDSLVAECSHVETPTSWLWWSFVTCISAAAGNNYSLVTLKGDLIYKPNLYVMLLGESGLGKGFGINRAKLLVSKADITRVIAGRSSIQAVVKELATAKSRKDKPPMTDSRGYIVNGELSTAIIADPDALTILTDLYDGQYNPEWTNLLKMDGAERLKEPYITCLFGSSPAHFYDSVPQVNIEGGYIGRNLIIYEERRSKDTDLLDIDISEKKEQDNKFDNYLVPKYVPHLQKIASNTGRLVPSDLARTRFNDWRRKWRSTQDSDKTGFLNRVPDHALKIAMCLALSEWKFNGEISELNIIDAIQRVTNLVYESRRTVSSRGKDPLAELSKMVLDELLKAPMNQLSRKILLTKGYGHFDAPTLDRIIENLLEIGWIRREKKVAGKATDWIIHLHGEPLDNYQKYLASKNGHLR